MRKRSIPVLLLMFLSLGIVGVWAGTSMGQIPPTPPPPITLPTLTVPTVTVPPAPLPPAPPPPPTPTVTVPSTPKLPVDPPKPPVPLPVTVPIPVTGTTAPETPATPPSARPLPSAPLGEGAGSVPTGRHYGASSRIATISRVKTSRRWVSTRGPSSRRSVLITFWLSRPGTIVFLVDELAPECRYVGKFLVRGRSGRNAVRFRGRVRGRALDPGTYRLTAHPRANRARRLTGVTVVIFEHPPGPAEIAAARARNTCPQGIPPSVRAATLAPDAERANPTSGVAGVQATSSTRRPYEDESTGPLGTAVESIQAIQAAAEAVPPILFALAALAIMLLALAAMPRPVRASRAGAALVHHRGTLALTGIGVLIAAILSFAVVS